MNDFIVALGLVLVIEGLLYALFAGPMRRMMAAAQHMPDNSLRIAGAVAMAAGVFVIWLARA